MTETNPFSLFARWFAQAAKSEAIEDPTVMCLSTIDLGGYPDARMVLLKEFDKDGFVFYTNLQSVKGRSLLKTSRAALTFYWDPLRKQVRVQGRTELVSVKEAEVYWKTRPRLSQIGAWASKQSEALLSREVLLKEVARYEKQFGKGPVPRPPHWTGIRVVPHKIEFWEGGDNRLHDRFRYERSARGWVITRLYP